MHSQIYSESDRELHSLASSQLMIRCTSSEHCTVHRLHRQQLAILLQSSQLIRFQHKPNAQLSYIVATAWKGHTTF
jgi:hypothetical protein